MSTESKIIEAFDAAKARAQQMPEGIYTLDEILKGNPAWDSLAWQHKGAVGDRFKTAVIEGEVPRVNAGAENPQTGDREYVIG